ncbi:hypothetical protein J2S43_001450 [Catenuloplanes nepalensis]|uniref:DUF222 domain-containing protein n=2 Tax=Catenuloplanes nepalensis TaxID=587533 RepID=A0ABT9MNA9_9ACTN|nr:hypothetical protein [Catenuloplanes nepalensis]
MTSLDAAVVTAREAGVVIHPGAVGALAARRAVYDGVERLRELVIGVDEEAVPVFRQSSTELRAVMTAGRRGTPEDVNRLLRAVVATAGEGESRRWPPARTGDGVAGDLVVAASALRAAGDVLASHLEPAGRARSQVGTAIRRGAGVAGALGDLASVTAAACRVDQELHRSLGRRGGAASARLREIHAGELRSIAVLSDRSVSRWLERAAARSQSSVLRHLRIAVPGDVAGRPVTKIRDVLVVVQSVAAHMFQHPERVTMVDIADACTLGSRLAALAATVGRTTRTTRSDGTVADPDATAVLWEQTARLAGKLGAQPGMTYPMRPAVAAAARLLREMDVATIRGSQAELVHTAARWLPDLAAGLRFALKQGITQGRLLAYTFVMTGTSGQLIHRTRSQWQVMTELDGPVATLADRLRTLTSAQHGHDDAAERAGSVTAIAGQLDNVRSGRAANSTRLRGHPPPLPQASPDRPHGRGR